MNLEDKIKKLSVEIETLTTRQRTLVTTISKANQELLPLGARKKNKTEEVKAAIQNQIESLRKEKELALAELKPIEQALARLKPELEKLEAQLDEKNRLDRLQAERDKYAQRQINGCGKTPSNKRDTTWRI